MASKKPATAAAAAENTAPPSQPPELIHGQLIAIVPSPNANTAEERFGINGQTVRLRSAADKTIATTATDTVGTEAGLYSFERPDPFERPYFIAVPSLYYDGSRTSYFAPDTSEIVVTRESLTNAGYPSEYEQLPNVIKGTLKEGVSGIKEQVVVLRATSGETVATTMTDSSGTYSFQLPYPFEPPYDILVPPTYVDAQKAFVPDADTIEVTGKSLIDARDTGYITTYAEMGDPSAVDEILERIDARLDTLVTAIAGVQSAGYETKETAFDALMAIRETRQEWQDRISDLEELRSAIEERVDDPDVAHYLTQIDELQTLMETEYNWLVSQEGLVSEANAAQIARWVRLRNDHQIAIANGKIAGLEAAADFHNNRQAQLVVLPKPPKRLFVSKVPVSMLDVTPVFVGGTPSIRGS